MSADVIVIPSFQFRYAIPSRPIISLICPCHLVIKLLSSTNPHCLQVKTVQIHRFLGEIHPCFPPGTHHVLPKTAAAHLGHRCCHRPKLAESSTAVAPAGSKNWLVNKIWDVAGIKRMSRHLDMYGAALVSPHQWVWVDSIYLKEWEDI